MLNLTSQNIENEWDNNKQTSDITFTNIQFDKNNLFFKSTPYKISFDRVKLKNTGTTCIYFKWQKLMKTFNLPDKKPDGIERFFCHYSDSKLFPNEEREFVFSFFSEKNGVFSEDWILNTSPPIKSANLIIHLNGMCLLLSDKYTQAISRLENNLSSNAIKTAMREYVLDLIHNIKEDEPPLPDMGNPKIFKFYFEKYNKEYNVVFSTFIMDQFKILLKQVQSHLNNRDEFWNGSIDSLKTVINRINDNRIKNEFEFKLNCLIHRSVNKKAEDSLLIPYFKSKLESFALEFNDICNSVREELFLHPVFFDYLTRISFLTEKEANLYKNELNKKKEEFYKKIKKKHLKPEEEEKELAECKIKIFETLREKLADKFSQIEKEKIPFLIEEIVMNSYDFNEDYIDRISRVKSIRSIKNEGLENKIVIIRIDIREYQHLFENILDEEGNLVEKRLKEIEFPNIKEILHSVSFFMNNQVKAVILLIDFGPKLGFYSEEFSTRYLCEYINKYSIIEQKVNFINNSDLKELQEKLNSEELRESELFILENLNFNPEECGYEIVIDKNLTKVVGSTENLKYFTKLKYVDFISMRDQNYPQTFLENQIYINDSTESIMKKFPSVIDMKTNLRAIGLRIESPIQKITSFLQIDSPNYMLIIGDFDNEDKKAEEEIILKKLLILNSIMLRFKVIFILGKLGIMLIHYLQKDFIIDPKYKINPIFYNLVKYILVKAHFNKIEIVLPVDGKILRKSEYENYRQEKYQVGDVIISLTDPNPITLDENHTEREINKSPLTNNMNNNMNDSGFAGENSEKKLIFKSAEEYGKYIKTLFKKEKKLQEVYQLYNIDNKPEEGEDYLDELNENEDYKENKLLEKEIEILNFYKNNQINFKYNSGDVIRSFVEMQNIDKPRKIFKNELEIRLHNEYIYRKPVVFNEVILNKSVINTNLDISKTKSNLNIENLSQTLTMNNPPMNNNTINNNSIYNYNNTLVNNTLNNNLQLTNISNTNTFNEENKKFLFDFEQFEFVDFGEKTYAKLVGYFNQMNCVMWLGKLSPSLIENFDDNYYKIVEFLYKRKSYLKQQFAYISTEGEKKLHESDMKAKKYLMNFFLKSKVSYGLVKRNLLTYLQPPEDKDNESPQDEEQFNYELNNLIDYFIGEDFEFVDSFLGGEHIPGFYGLMQEEKIEKEQELDLKFLEEI